METRSRKRAEASSSSTTSSSTRSSKRSRPNPNPSPTPTAAPAPSPAQPAQRARRSAAATLSPPAPQPPMDFPADNSNNNPPPRRRGRASNADKGKEQQQQQPQQQEHPSESSRLRDAERMLGLSFDDGMEDDDDAGGAFPHGLTSASSALQGLLRKLGAGLDDMLPSSALSAAAAAASSSSMTGPHGARMKSMLAGLRADGEEGRQVEALTQLCEMLSIGTEDSLAGFSVDSFVPVLVGLLNHESNPDIMLLAARALTHLCDVLPSSCASVVHYGAVACFCARLLTIEYMDLAEQSLQALKKISQEHPTPCLRAGALMAVLSYLDFFSTGVQRVALSTAANMCRKLPSDASDFVMEAVPLLTNLLNYHDAKVLEHASVCLTRIAEAFASSPEKLDELCNHGLVAQAAGLVSVSNSAGQASLSTVTYTGVIRLLSICASGSPLAAKTLLLHGISGTLKDILSASGLVAGTTVSPTLTRPADQMYEIVNLADALLPPLPVGIISLPAQSHAFVKGSSIRRPASSKQGESGSIDTEVSGREKLLRDQPELLQQFGMDILPTMTQVYGSSVNGSIRHKCLSVIAKLMYYSSAEMIEILLGTTNISSFLAGILSWKDPQVLIPALQIAEILMEKLPGTFSKMFVREGVVHAVESLICLEISSPMLSQVSPREKDIDSGTCTSSRSRRSRRRSSTANTDNNSLDEPKGSHPVIASSPPSTLEGPNTSHRASVSDCAKSFKDKYFPSDPGSSDIAVTDDLLKLRTLCAKLNTTVDTVKTKAKGKSKSLGGDDFDILCSVEEQLDNIIAEILSELSKGDGVSTFEFIGSGIIAALLNYLSCGTFEREKVSEANLPKLRQQALRRYKAFIYVALPNDAVGNKTPMSFLVEKLQSALSSLERFPVVLSHSGRTSSSGGSRLSSGLSALSQPLKLRLCRAQGEKSLKDYSSNIVLIDPLASLAAVEDFLWPRIQRSESVSYPAVSSGKNSESVAPSATTPVPSSTQSVRRPSTRSKSLATVDCAAKKDTQEGSRNTSKGKGKAVVKSPSDEPKGPHTRTAACRKVASEKDAEVKPARDQSSSEDDEELDASPFEADDGLMIGDDDDDVSDDEDDDHEVLPGSLPVCVPENVHDVKLADADESSIASVANDNQTQLLAGSSIRDAFSSRGAGPAELRKTKLAGAMSFAAAAMAGLASVGSHGIRGSRDRHGLSLGTSAHERANKLLFTTGGKQLSKHLTVYQAMQYQVVHDEDDEESLGGADLPNDGSRFWGDIFTITYQKADNEVDKGSIRGSASVLKSSKSDSCKATSEVQRTSLLDSILQGELPCDFEKSTETYNILALLRVLEGLNQLSPRLRLQAICDDFAEGNVATLDGLYGTGAKVPSEEFVSNKLTPKLARQIQDVLALCSGSLPSWCYQMTKACPFLFPFETRRQHFYSTAFGLSRALNRLQQQQGDNNSATEREVRVGRLQRQKVRVSRNRILDSAAKVMEMFSTQKAVLEVEYFGEVGTGLGPTLEFYTLLSHDLQRVGLGLWRSDSPYDSDTLEAKKLDSNSPGGARNLIQAPLGLFPRPWPPSTASSEGSKFFKVVDYFRLVGRVMAKALQDGRLLDLPLSTAFYKLLLGQELDLYDILSFDAEFGKILQELQILVERKRFLESCSSNNQQIKDLCFRGASVEDLCLDFTLPGYPDYVLKEGEENTVVSIYNLEEYISLVVDATIKNGIMRQVDAFKAGFNQVFDISSLQIFSPQELDYLICGRRELWEPETLVEHIKFDHGYTSKSPAIVNLLEIMTEFTPEQQHAFCQFVTGAPRLPPGGLSALNPKLTIVRKHSSTAVNTSNAAGATESADDDLPSVMTCANYLKLPPYSTKEVMHKKLLYAINEGQGSFDLS